MTRLHGRRCSLVRITLALVVGWMISLHALSQCSAAPEADGKRDVIRIIGFGDSITQGAKSNVTFCALIQSELQAKKINVEVLNAGIGGNRTDQGLARLEKDVLSKKPQYVTIMFGTNDAAFDMGKDQPRLPIANYEENLRKIVTQVQAAGIQPILMTPPPLASTYGPGKNPVYSAKEGPNFMLKNYVEVVRKIAGETKAPLIDNFDVWSQVEQKELNARFADGVHPNAAGHRILADTILKTLLPLLESKPAQ